MDLLLVELPFKNIDRPNIGLSILDSTARQAGFHSDIWYENLQFAKICGEKLYRFISLECSPNHLVGDILLAHLLSDDPYGVAKDCPTKVNGLLRDSLFPNLNIKLEIEALLPQFDRLFHEIAQRVADARPKLVGLTAMFQIVPSLLLAKRIKKLEGDLEIVLGGPLCHGPSARVLLEKFGFIDYVCQGEGETFIVDLLEATNHSRGSLSGLPGLVWRNQNGEVENNIHQSPTDLEKSPAPDFSGWLKQLKTIFGNLEPNQLWLPIETSRGCWWGEKHHCIFCGLMNDSMTFRTKSDEKILNEIATLSHYGIKNLFSVDLILSNKHYRSLVPKIIEQKTQENRFFFEVKSNLDYDKLKLLKEAGFIHLQPGIESLNSKALKHMRKGVKAYQNVLFLKWAYALGIKTYWNILFGFPGEDPEWYKSMADDIKYLHHLQPPTSGLSRVRIDRFSPLFNDSDLRGGQPIRPLMPYYKIFPELSEEEVFNIAYYFEIPNSGSDQSFKYIESLQSEVRKWQRVHNDTVFVSLRTKGCIYFYDSRGTSSSTKKTLEDIDADIYSHCEYGISPKSLSTKIGLEDVELDQHIKRLVDGGFIRDWDGVLVSLAVPFTGPVPSGVTSDIAIDYVSAVLKVRNRRATSENSLMNQVI